MLAFLSASSEFLPPISPPEGVVLSGVEVGLRGQVDDFLDNVGFFKRMRVAARRSAWVQVRI